MTHHDHSVTSSSATLAERLQALEAEVARLKQTAQLFEQSPTAAVVLDAQGRILKVNTRGSELLGASAATLTGRQLAQLLSSTSQGTLSALLGRAQKSGQRQLGEVQRPRQDLLLDIAAQPTTGGDLLYHLTLTDVTDFKEAHRHLLTTTQDQMEQLQEAGMKLRRSNEEFEMVMSISKQHLQERLNRAENFLALYHREMRPGDLTHVGEAVLQTRNLLGSLDRYMQTRFMRTRLRQVNLEQVWREVLKDTRDQLQGRDVQLSSAALPVVQGDTQVLYLVLNEYLTNALKFTRTRDQTRLRLLVQETDSEYRIGLEDNGVGFNMRSRDKVFALFGRLHSAELYEGTGIGLTAVQRLCERFGSRTWAESKVEQGATFWFSWPKTLSRNS